MLVKCDALECGGNDDGICIDSYIRISGLATGEGKCDEFDANPQIKQEVIA